MFDQLKPNQNKTARIEREQFDRSTFLKDQAETVEFRFFSRMLVSACGIQQVEKKARGGEKKQLKQQPATRLASL